MSARNQMVQFDVSGDFLAETWSKFVGKINNISTTADTTADTTAAPPTPVLPSERQLRDAFNKHLPSDVKIKNLIRVDMNFNVMKPMWKRYHYVYPADKETLAQYARIRRSESSSVTNSSRESSSSETNPPILPPSLSAMQSAALYLVGKHDFGSYQSSNGRKTTIRTVHECVVSINDEKQMVLSITSNGFLMHQVRIVAGTLLEVGCGLRTMNDLKRAFDEINRKKGGRKLPGKHLTLDWVEYEESFASEKSRN